MDLKFLDVVVGTIFIYLLLSLFASTLMELLATYLKMRSKDLKKTIQRMLDDEPVANADKNASAESTDQATGEESQVKKNLSSTFYDNALIKYFAEVPKDEWVKSALPSYLTKKNFSKVLIDEILKAGKGKQLTYQDLQNGIAELEKLYPDSRKTLEFIKGLQRDCEGDVAAFKASLEQWFDDTMERASGWYKRKTQWILLYLGFVIAFFFNADTFQIVKYMNDNPEARSAMVQRAQDYVKPHPNGSIPKDSAKADDDLGKQADSLLADLAKQDKEILALSGPIGWKDGFVKGVGAAFCNCTIWLKLLGFLLTALAVSLGATFWFDMLNKIINIRSAGKNEDGNGTNGDAKPTQPVTVNVNTQKEEEAVG